MAREIEDWPDLLANRKTVYDSQDEPSASKLDTKHHR